MKSIIQYRIGLTRVSIVIRLAHDRLGLSRGKTRRMGDWNQVWIGKRKEGIEREGGREWIWEGEGTLPIL